MWFIWKLWRQKNFLLPTHIQKRVWLTLIRCHIIINFWVNLIKLLARETLFRDGPFLRSKFYVYLLLCKKSFFKSQQANIAKNLKLFFQSSLQSIRHKFFSAKRYHEPWFQSDFQLNDASLTTTSKLMERIIKTVVFIENLF